MRDEPTVEAKYFGQVLTVGDLRKIMSKSELSALAVAAYTASETSGLRKMLTPIDNLRLENGAEKWLCVNQKLALMRLLSLRILEFIKFVESCERQKGCLSQVSTEAKKVFAHVFSSTGSEIARHLRDKVVAHTTLTDVKEALKSAPDSVDASIFENSNPLNSVYMLGEEVIFSATFREFEKRGMRNSEIWETWFYWCRSGVDLVLFYHTRLKSVLILDRMSNPSAQEITVSIKGEFLVNEKTSVFPLYWHSDP